VGCVVERCPSKELFRRPLHPYTKGLLSAIPIPSIDRAHKRILMQGELTTPIDPKPGCRFANRCPYAKDICTQKQPDLVDMGEGHLVACHCVREINSL
jgi:peptide/nickel transport system ATP-binding protein